jgi:hypothetical protein
VRDLKLGRRLLLAAIEDTESGGAYLHHRIKLLSEINRELDSLGSSEGAPIDEVAAARQARRQSIAQDPPPAIGSE